MCAPNTLLSVRALPALADLLSAVLRCVYPRCLGKTTVKDLLCASLDKLEVRSIHRPLQYCTLFFALDRLAVYCPFGVARSTPPETPTFYLYCQNFLHAPLRTGNRKRISPLVLRCATIIQSKHFTRSSCRLIGRDNLFSTFTAPPLSPPPPCNHHRRDVHFPC